MGEELEPWPGLNAYPVINSDVLLIWFLLAFIAGSFVIGEWQRRARLRRRGRR